MRCTQRGSTGLDDRLCTHAEDCRKLAAGQPRGTAAVDRNDPRLTRRSGARRREQTAAAPRPTRSHTICTIRRGSGRVPAERPCDQREHRRPASERRRRQLDRPAPANGSTHIREVDRVEGVRLPVHPRLELIPSESSAAQAFINMQPARHGTASDVRAMAGPRGVFGNLNDASTHRIVVNVRDHHALVLGPDRKRFCAIGEQWAESFAAFVHPERKWRIHSATPRRELG